VVQLYGAANHVRVAAEFDFPEPVAQDDHVLSARRVLLLPEDAPERRPGFDDFEKARADGSHSDASRGARAGQRELSEAAAWIERHAFERSRLPLPTVELARGELERTTVRTRCPGVDPHQAFRLLERQRTQQNRVHDAEYRRVRADAERQN